MSWKEKYQKHLKRDKYLSRNMSVVIDGKTANLKELMVDGKWGKRLMYSIEDIRGSKILISPKQFEKIAEALEPSNYLGKIRVQIDNENNMLFVEV